MGPIGPMERLCGTPMRNAIGNRAGPGPIWVGPFGSIWVGPFGSIRVGPLGPIGPARLAH